MVPHLYLLFLLTLGLRPCIIQCLSTTNTPSSNRIFVAGLGPSTQAQELENSFGVYGQVKDVSLMNFESTAPYAFVTFDSVEAAERAIQNSRDYEVEPARPMIPRQKSKERNDKIAQDCETKQQVAQKSNVVLQLHNSHLERFQDFLAQANPATINQPQEIEVVGSIDDTGSRNVALMGLRVVDTTVFLNWLKNLPFTIVGLNKVYVVDPASVITVADPENESMVEQAIVADHENESMEQAIGQLAERIRKELPSDSILRLHVFPPKLASSILKQLEHHSLGGIQIAPTGHTHLLNVVQLLQSSTTSKDVQRTTWMMGTSERSMTWSSMQDRLQPLDGSSTGIDAENDNVCRAYYKLQEAFCRYKEDVWTLWSSHQNARIVALDCGASPGGWTKYLCEKDGMSRVYSIDPGALDPAVAALSPVEHLRLKIQDALPLLKEQNVHIDLWVSDMCLHEMSKQIDWLLTARDVGLIGPGTFFVLTLKCKVGHSKASFDGQVARECQRLEGITQDLQTIHLFSNRNGERTVMGYLT